MSAKTSLARQLELLKLPQTSAHKEKHGSVSFLYDFFESRTIDSDTHFSLAVSGLENLIQLDPYIATYRENLFHESSKKFDRGVQSEEVNEKLNQVVEEYLFRVVSKYFQLTDTHKTLEWLIYRYRVNEYNTDALIGCVLPYHETRLFVRLLQTCSAVKNPRNNRWFWLKAVQENGVPLAKSILLEHCGSNLEFVRFITDTVFKSMQIDPQNSMFASFLVSFVLNLLERSPTESILAMTVSAVSKALRMKNEQLYISSYLIFSHLCTVTRVDLPVVQKILALLLRHLSPQSSEGAVLAFAIIIRSQELTTLPIEFISEEFVTNLQLYTGKYNLESVIRCLLQTMISSVDSVEDLESIKGQSGQLLRISNCISEDTIKSVITSINDHEDRGGFLLHLVKLIEKLYPVWFENAISCLSSLKNVSMFLNSARYSLVDSVQVPLFVGLKHSSRKIRRESMLYFARNLPTLSQSSEENDLTYLRNVIETNLLQDLQNANPEVLLQIFSIGESIFNLLEPKNFERIAAKLISYCEDVELEADEEGDLSKWSQLKCLLLKTFCSKIYDCYAQDDGSFLFRKFFSYNQFDVKLFNLLIVSNENQFNYANTILNSNFGKSNPLLKNLESATKSTAKKLKKSFELEQGLAFSKAVINCVVEHLKENFDSSQLSFTVQRLIHNLSNCNSHQLRRFALLYLLVLTELYQSNQLEVESQNLLSTSILNILLVLLTSYKLGSRSHLKFSKGSDFERHDSVESFLHHLTISNKEIPVYIVGQVTSVLVKHLNLCSSEKSFDTYFGRKNSLPRLYQLLLHYSTMEGDKHLSKKVYKLFRDLLFSFITRVTNTEDGNNAFNFFLPLISDCSNSYLQRKTLGLLSTLLRLEPLASTLVASLESNPSFMIVYLIALSSENLNTRKFAVKNLNVIHSKMEKNSDLKQFLEQILNVEESYIGNPNSISVKINKLQKKNNCLVLDSLFESIFQLLTSTEECNNSDRGSLLKLLRSSSESVKKTIFEHYRRKFFDPSVPRQRLTVGEETELASLLDFYRFDRESLFDSKEAVFVEFFLHLMKATEDVFSEQFAASVVRLFTDRAFGKMRTLNEDFVIRLVSTLLQVQLRLSETVSTNADHWIVINAIRKQISQLQFEAQFVVKLLGFLLPIEEIYDSYAYTKKDVPAEKRVKRDEAEKSKFAIGWKLLRILLGFIQNISIENSGPLVKCLFDYLKLTFMDVEDNSNEYTRQTILIVIMNCVEATVNRSEESMQVDVNQRELQEFFNNFNVDIIVDCMRESRLKQTQKTALHLLNSVAPYFQRQIIEYLVAIFTFIGTSLIQCDDVASLDILLETLDSIIPVVIQNDTNLTLVKSKKSDSKQYIISVFVKSFTDIPTYRRLELFKKLVDLLGREQFLPVVVVRLLEQASQLKTKSKSDKQVWTDFVSELFAAFPVPEQLKSLCTLLTLFEFKFFDPQLKKKSLQQDLVENVSTVDGENQELVELQKLVKSTSKHFTTTLVYETDKFSCGIELLKFIGSFISAKDFVQHVQSIDYEHISCVLIYFLNQLLQLIVSLNPNADSIKSSLNLYRKKIKLSLDDILLSFNSLVPHERLIEIVIQDLLANTTNLEPIIAALVKRKALELLNSKLIKLNSTDIGEHIAKKILKKIGTHLESGDANCLDDVQIHNMQLMFLSLKLAAKFFESDKKEESISKKTLKCLAKIVKRIIELTNSIEIQATDSEARVKQMRNLKGSSILCITQIMCSMSLEGIRHLSEVLHIILNNFDTTDEIIIISNVSALSKIIFKFGQFLSPHLKPILLKLLYSYTLCDQISNLRSKLQSIWNELAKSVPKRILFEAINSSYEEACDISHQSIIELMSLFKLTCLDLEKSDVDIIVKSFKDFMIKALSYRALHYCEMNVAAIEPIESAFGDAFSAFIPKLTESSFRPIFYHLLDWSIRIEDKKILADDGSYSLPDESYHRMVAFYRFCSYLADRLKSLFCVFVAPSILKNCSELLLAYHSDNSKAKNEEEFMDVDQADSSQSGKLLLANSDIGEPLVAAILATLSKCFLYDLNTSFVNKDSSALIIKPVVNQVRFVLAILFHQF